MRATPDIQKLNSTEGDNSYVLDRIATAGSNDAALRGPLWLRTLESTLVRSSNAVLFVFPDGRQLRCGTGKVVAEVRLRNARALRSLESLDEGNIAQSYIDCDLDLTGDMLALLDLRRCFSDRHRAHSLWRFIQPIFLGQIRTNAKAISVHYDQDPEFYLSFLDETRCYTQGIFHDDNEPLNVAIRRKFDYCLESCRLGPGSHILEVGPGWGAFTEYAAERGIRITAVTISRKSKEYVDSLGPRTGNCNVQMIDFLKYAPGEQYDAIVVMGIMEHLPQYDQVTKRFWRLLKPGGVVYLDASATRAKYDVSSFIYRNIYPANHSFFVLHDFLKAVANSPLQVRSVAEDRHNYFLTFKHWAEKLESNREHLISRFGETNYRRFHLYLWGSVHSFRMDVLQCYRVVLDKPLS